MPTKIFFQIIQDRPRVQSAAREQRFTVAASEPEAEDDTSSEPSSNSQCVVCYGQAREGTLSFSGLVL